MVTLLPPGHAFGKDPSSSSEGRNMFPIRVGCSLEEATAQDMLLFGAVWTLSHGSHSEPRRRIWVSNVNLLRDSRGGGI